MGTNYYMMTRDRRLAHECFVKKLFDNNKSDKDDKSNKVVYDDQLDEIVHNDEPNKAIYTEPDYEIVEYPYLGWRLHLNKLSSGWRPLFQMHDCFNTFEDLRTFYHCNKDLVEIYDEYEHKLTWEEYVQKIMRHLDQPRVPMKWDYKVNPLSRSQDRYLTLDSCEPYEADIWSPLSHVNYVVSEQAARKKFGVGPGFYADMEYSRDPQYPIDWTPCEFD